MEVILVSCFIDNHNQGSSKCCSDADKGLRAADMFPKKYVCSKVNKAIIIPEIYDFLCKKENNEIFRGKRLGEACYM